MESRVKHVARPKFKDLPLDPSHPQHSAWGVWGAQDQLGCLNNITPRETAEASKLVQSGISIGLNWDLAQMRVPPVFRTELKHKIFSIGMGMNDDLVEFNTQTSSQWDGFRHCPYPGGKFYNGVTQANIEDRANTQNGIHEWAKKGIVGRGVLIDYHSYAQKHGIDYDPWSYHTISVSTMEDIAKECGITFKVGDVLLLRTGFVPRYESKSTEELKAEMAKPAFYYPGLEGSLTSLEWLWDTGFAAVAGDSPGFEAWTALEERAEGNFPMHHYLLSGFGLPIGEMFDLEELARQCKEQQRWEFMFVSEPLNLVGGVGSPPNAVAIL